MGPNIALRLALFATLPVLSSGFTVTPSYDTSGKSMAEAIFTGDGLSVVNWDLFAAGGSLGTFTDGPFGIGNGGILTTGLALGAIFEQGPGLRNVNNEYALQGQLDQYCGANSQNAAVLYAGVFLAEGYDGVRLEFIFATEEADGGQPDTIGILNYDIGLPQLAVDSSGNRLTAQSAIIKNPNAILPPDSVTGYSRSSPPLVVTIPGAGPRQVDLYLSVCDINNANYDSALLLKGTACTDCELTPNGPEINYVKQTTTLERGEQAYTSTIPASGTASGTFIFFVEPEETTTTTSEEPTPTDTTTTTNESTETTPTGTGSTTAVTTSSEITTTSGETEMTTTTTTEEPTTTTDTTTNDNVSTDTTTNVSVSTDTTTASSGSDTTGTTNSETTTTSGRTTRTTSQFTDAETSTETSTELSSTFSGKATSSDYSISTTTTNPTDASTATTDSISESATTALSEPTTFPLTTSTTATTNEEPVLEIESTTTTAISSNTASWSSSDISLTGTSSDLANPTTTSPFSSSATIISFPISSSETSSMGELQTLTSDTAPAITSQSSPILSTSVQSPIPSSSISASPPANGLSNLPFIQNYQYVGCLGSLEGYPSFSLLGPGANITITSCINLAKGRAYVGIYQRSCYAADSLDSASLVANAQCDIPCPGDETHACGGLAGSSFVPRWSGARRAMHRRDAPANILLTLYGLRDETQPGITTTTENAPPTTKTNPVIIPNTSTGREDEVSTSRLQGPTSVIGPKPVVTVSGSIQVPAYSVPYSSVKPGQTLVATTVTTVTYTIVDPYNPSALTVAEYCTTLSYEPCTRCAHQPIPSVDMTTQVIPCNRCGNHGENEVTVTLPCAAVTKPTSNQPPYKQSNLPQGPHQPESLAQPSKPAPIGNHAVPEISSTVATNIRQARPTAYGSERNGYSDEHHYYGPVNGTSTGQQKLEQQKQPHEPSNPQAPAKNNGYPEPQQYTEAAKNKNPATHPTAIQKKPSSIAPGTASTPNYGPTVPEVVVAAGGRLQMDMLSLASILIGLVFVL